MPEPDYESLADTITANFRTMKGVEASVEQMKLAISAVATIASITVLILMALLVRRLILSGK